MSEQSAQEVARRVLLDASRFLDTGAFKTADIRTLCNAVLSQHALIIDAKHVLTKARVWSGMGWHYNPLHPLYYKPLLDKIEAETTPPTPGTHAAEPRKE